MPSVIRAGAALLNTTARLIVLRQGGNLKMYCSSCGAAVTSSLSYCNRCGTELKAKQHSPMNLSEVSLQSIVWAIASVTIVGLGIVIGMMAVMKEVLHFHDGLIIAFSLLSFLSFLGVDFVFIWVLLRSRAGAKETNGASQDKHVTRRGLDEAQARALPEPALSVTEHTTRTLEGADKDHKAK
jgi:uncharacterized paraquat-inducible protein A